MKRIVSTFILSGLSLTANAQSYFNTEVFDIAIKMVTVIGAREEQGLKYLFTNPIASAKGRNSTLLVADRVAMNVREYSKTGKYLRSFGERGHAPGQFSQILEVYSDTLNGKLFVVDGINLRLTEFDLITGDVAGTSRFEISYGNPHATILTSGKHAFILTSSQIGRIDALGTKYPRLFVYDSSNTDTIPTVAAIGTDDWNADDFIADQLKLDPGPLYESRDGYIYYAPHLFDGKIYKFSVDKGLQSIIQGVLGTEQRYQIVSGPNNGHYPDAGNTPKGKKQMLYYRFPCQSLGIFNYGRSNNLAHFTFCEVDGSTRQVAVEFFSHGGKSIAIGTIKKWTDGLDNNTGLSIGEIDYPFIYGYEYGEVPVAFIAEMVPSPRLRSLLEKQ